VSYLLPLIAFSGAVVGRLTNNKYLNISPILQAGVRINGKKGFSQTKQLSVNPNILDA